MIAASQNDFEEFGIDQSTLDEMKQVRGAFAVRRMLFAPPVLCLSTSPSSISFFRRRIVVRLFFGQLLYFHVSLVVRMAGSAQMAACHCVVLGGAKSGAESPDVSQERGPLSIWGHFIAQASPRQVMHIPADLGVATSCDVCRLPYRHCLSVSHTSLTLIAASADLFRLGKRS